MNSRITLETAQSLALGVALVASCCTALPEIGQARDAKSCTTFQVQSPAGSSCVSQLEKDLVQKKTDTHVLTCDAVSVQCCVQKNLSGPVSQCGPVTPVAAGNISKVQVTIASDSKPLKIVILTADGGFVDIGRTSDYVTGGATIDLKRAVSKFHWEVFAPGAVEPCQKLRDVTSSSITVGCKAEEKKAATPR